jgi:hypothetical protein
MRGQLGEGEGARGVLDRPLILGQAEIHGPDSARVARTVNIRGLA